MADMAMWDFFGRSPQQTYLDGQSRELANADFSEPDRPTAADHELHVAGKVCAYCGEVISASQPARLAGESDWVHDSCHKPRD
jgi:hypothetical protein